MSTSAPAAAAAPIAADTQSNPPGEDGSSATGCDSSVGRTPRPGREAGQAQVVVALVLLHLFALGVRERIRGGAGHDHRACEGRAGEGSGQASLVVAENISAPFLSATAGCGRSTAEQRLPGNQTSPLTNRR